MMHTRLKKENCAVLRRSSSPQQADTSNTNQQRTVEQVLATHQMKVVYEIDLKGVSGSVPGNRTDINEIIAEHQRTGDFSYLVLPSADRFTRAGSIHGIAMLYELLVEGIIVYFVKEDLFSDVERDRTYLGFLFDAAKQSVLSTSTSSTEGNTYSILDGRSPHTRRPPFGLDRLYLVDGKPVHIVRNLRDGTQEMWSPESDQRKRKLLRRFGRNPRRGTTNHYLKQRNERVMLVPGDPKHLSLINLIMRYAWVNNWGEGLIAKNLNNRARTNSDFLSATGNYWAKATIWYVCRSAVYTGLGIRFMTNRGVHVKGTKQGRAADAGVTMKELATQKRPSVKRRPRSEWLELPQPQLLKLLEPDVRDVANERIGEYLNGIASGQKPKRNSRASASNSRLLTGILRSKQGNLRMVGYAGKAKYRYYQTLAASSTPASDKTKNRLVPGMHLEPAVLEVLADAITHHSRIKLAMREAIRKVVSKRPRNGKSPETLEREVKSIRAQQLSLNRRLTGDDAEDEELRIEIDGLEERLVHLRGLLAARRTPNSKFNLESKVEQYTKEFVELGGDIKSMDKMTVRTLLRHLVKSMVVDLETREVEVTFALPSWMSGHLVGNPKVTVLSSFQSKTRQNSHHENRAEIASYTLTYDWQDQRYCWQRKKTA